LARLDKVVGALFLPLRASAVSDAPLQRMRAVFTGCAFFLPQPISISVQGGFKNLQNRSRRRQSAHFSSIIGMLAPTAVGGYDFLKPP